MAGRPASVALPQSHDVDLTIYNIAGQQVLKLVDGFRNPGQYRITWDGRDSKGQALASGLYFYRLQAGDQIESRKLLMLR